MTKWLFLLEMRITNNNGSQLFRYSTGNVNCKKEKAKKKETEK